MNAISKTQDKQNHFSSNQINNTIQKREEKDKVHSIKKAHEERKEKKMIESVVDFFFFDGVCVVSSGFLFCKRLDFSKEMMIHIT